MNVQEYISSGIVESYVLGLASDEERREFEQMCIQHPEVIAARNAFELALEREVMQNAMTPPLDLKEKILGQINDGAKVISLQERSTARTGWWKYASAAAIILLAGSLYWNISLYNKNRVLKKDYDNSVARLNDVENDMHVMMDRKSVKMAALKGMDISPESYTTVYWDTASHDVFLLTNNLPAPPTDKQYQLWALLNGKPVDLGMLDFDVSQKKLLVRMKNAQNAQAFAITLEKKDRPNPTTPAGDMYVMGKL